ncbi:MAG: hypothetical protein K5888_05945 [Lachnospiraceae bacterium]|nr:hypothetical protein [Lachnospiraceae bacterium]
MKKVIYTSTAVKAVILIIATLLILSVYPCRMWTETKVFGTPEVSAEETPVINYLNGLMEVFVASDTHLQSIRLFVNSGTYTKEFNVELTDGSGKHINTVTVKTPETLPGYVDITFDAETVPQELYILKFTSLQSLHLGMEPFEATSQVLVVPYYNDTPLDAKALIMDFEYRVPVSVSKSLLIIGLIILTAAVLLAFTEMRIKDPERDGLVTVESVMKKILNPVTALLLVACIVFIAMGHVSTFLPDNIFAVISVILLGAVLFYAINHKKSPEPVFTVDYFRTHISDIIQSLGIAYAIQACCEYVSGLYDIHHRVAERKEMIGFAIAIIAMLGFAEIFNLYNLIFVIAALIAGRFYINANITEEMTSDDRFVVKANVAVAILFGLILIRTVKSLIQRKLSKPNLICSLVTIVYFALIVIFRNTRWWTVILAVSFLLLFLNYGMWDKKKNFLTNLVRGVVIQFILCTIWCLMHRPFVTFRCARYTHFFHTETITATYMTVVSCVTLVLLLSKIKRLCFIKDENGKTAAEGTCKLSDIWKELILLGVSVSYLLFTFARTAYAATITAFAFLLIAVFAFAGKNGMKLAIRTIGWMIVAVAVMLPITFELQRTIPVLVSDPYEYDIDEYEDNVMHGRELSSANYMLVGRLWELFQDKILGIDVSNKMFYFNEFYAPDEYHATMKELYDLSGGYKWDGLFIEDEQWDQSPTRDMFEMYLDRNEPDPASVYTPDAAESVPVEEATAVAEETAAPEETMVAEEATAEEADTEGSQEAGSETYQDYTNGRTGIFRSYIEQLNMTGHDSMGAVLEDGEIATHAHDVYLQVAFDHGIPTGIVFVLFGLTLFVMSIIYYRNSDDKYGAVTMTLIVAFAVAGVVEWVYHLSHPMSYIMLLSSAPLMFYRSNKEQKGNAD